MSTVELKPRDFKSDQEVRWCPGCGDYAILNATQQAMAEMGVPKEKFVIVSGIGCSSRFPYYMNTYGMHTIHGRAPAIAMGVKMANPELSVWVMTGDGDAMSIGGNHLIHAMRRNIDLKIVMFNNRIYALTKGQYSPTTPKGQKTKTSPFGVVDNPFHPLYLAIGTGATFVARTLDTNPKHIKKVLKAAQAHKGVAFIEVWQNCVIFNDGTWKDYTAREVRDDRVIDLRPGEPMVFGKEHDKGIKLGCDGPQVVSADEADVWDPSGPSPLPAFMMAHLDDRDDMPHAIGIFRDDPEPTFEADMHDQIRRVTEEKGEGTLKDLIYTKDVWTVE